MYKVRLMFQKRYNIFGMGLVKKKKSGDRLISQKACKHIRTKCFIKVRIPITLSGVQIKLNSGRFIRNYWMSNRNRCIKLLKIG